MKIPQLSLFRLFARPAKRLSKAGGTVTRSRRIKPDAELKAAWEALVARFFPERIDLNDYVISWSQRRQKRVLASCNVRQRRVNVARELQHRDYFEWVEPVLFHELCHAVLGDSVAKLNGKRAWHGAEFKNLESLHPRSAELHRWMSSGGWAKAVRSDRARRRVLKN